MSTYDLTPCGNRWKFGKDECARERGHIGPHRNTETSEAHTFRWFDSEGTPHTHTPAVEPPAQRCPAAHPEDPTPCGGPVAVTVLDAQNAGAAGCEHHGARLLASLDGGRVYALPDAPDGAAIRTFKAAATLRPFAWLAPEGGEGR